MLQVMLASGSFTGLPPEAALFLVLMLKVLFIVAALLYLVFAFVVVRQIQVMKGTVVTPFSPVVQLIGFIHLFMALGALLLAALML